MSVKKVSCRFEHFLSLSKKKKLHAIVILLQYLLKMIVRLLFSNRRLLSVHQRLTKRIGTNYVKKNTFFHFSVKDLVNFIKNSKDIRDLHRSRKFTCYFSCKRSFMQHPQFLLHE